MSDPLVGWLIALVLMLVGNFAPARWFVRIDRWMNRHAEHDREVARQAAYLREMQNELHRIQAVHAGGRNRRLNASATRQATRGTL